ncbi:MAG: restriction endonuclease [Chloroflexota bacterium]
MNWRDYEVYITRHFQRLFPDASVEHDVRRIGALSKIERQIDILIEGKVAGFDLTIVIDCKYFGKKVDVKDVDEFLGYLHDLRASKGIIVTNNGYTEAAHNRAMNDTRDIELRIIEFKDLERYQGFLAIPYFGAHGAVVSAPEGWVVDANPPKPQLAAFYPMGLSRREAFHTEGYIYFAYSKKDAKWPNLDHLLNTQEQRIRAHYRNPMVAHEPVQLRDDCVCRVRHLEADEIPDIIESSLFLDFPDVIIYLNLLAPRSKHSEYVRKLYWIAEKLIKVNVLYDATVQPLTIWRNDSEA